MGLQTLQLPGAPNAAFKLSSQLTIQRLRCKQYIATAPHATFSGPIVQINHLSTAHKAGFSNKAIFVAIKTKPPS